jgi:hypothetical protein
MPGDSSQAFGQSRAYRYTCAAGLGIARATSSVGDRAAAAERFLTSVRPPSSRIPQGLQRASSTQPCHRVGQVGLRQAIYRSTKAG